MERRLTRAFDHMTMPDDCARRIESRLQAELQNRKPGQYTKTVSPFVPRRSSWAAAVCLMLMLVLGGAALFVGRTESIFYDSHNLYFDPEAGETIQSTTPKDYYHSATSLSAEEVENFASVVRYLILTENWKALADKLQYPITIEQQEILDEEAFTALMENISLGSHFLMSMKYESCIAMLCDEEIIMGDGQVCISEVQGKQLKITSISRLTETAEDMVHFVYATYADGTKALHQYTGYEENVTVPKILGNSVITQIGTEFPVIVNGDVVKTVKIPDTVNSIADSAFANCPVLEAVYFSGDAPPEAEGVFEGSEKVVVYYRNGAKGWGDTWCGRKTMEYGEGHISLGTVTVQDRVPEVFEAILSGASTAFYGNRGNMTVQEYCASIWGDDTTANAFTLADMDADGVCELVFSVQDADGVVCGYFALWVDGTDVCSYTLRGRDLRKDGTFYSYTAKENSSLRFQDETSFFVESTDFSQQDKPLAQWHSYPCQLPELVLESYRYASETGFSTHPGNPYAYFELLSYGEMGNDWNLIQQWLSREGNCVEEKDMVYAFDPDAPGCVFYGTLTGTGDQRKLRSMGYYVCDETGEKRAEVWDLDQPDPVYTVEVPRNDRGREVETPEEMLSYMDFTPYYGEIPRDAQKIAELLDYFVHRYCEQNRNALQEYMAEDVETIRFYPFANDVYILTYGILPEATLATGEKWRTSAELLEAGETGARYHLEAELIKTPDGWKIQSFTIETA